MANARSELDRVVGQFRLATLRRASDGGEWDTLRSCPIRVRRRLTGAGWLTRGGEPPDVLADFIIDRVSSVATTCEAIEWYLSTAEAAVREQKSEAWRRQYQNRTRRAADAGFGSYWYLRLYRSELGSGALW